MLQAPGRKSVVGKASVSLLMDWDASASRSAATQAPAELSSPASLNRPATSIPNGLAAIRIQEIVLFTLFKRPVAELLDVQKLSLHKLCWKSTCSE
eukprot:5731042-Amphidinium_carterae.1